MVCNNPFNCCSLILPLEGIDLLAYQLLQIYPLVVSVFNAVDHAVQFKNSSKTYCYNFAYPTLGSITFNINQLLEIRRLLDCITQEQILDEIGHLETDLECNRRKLLRYVFMLLYKINRTVGNWFKAVSLARSQRNTGKSSCYIFINDIPTCAPIEQRSKLYTCLDMNYFSNMIDHQCNPKTIPDVFNITACSCNCPDDDSCEDCECPDDCDRDPFESIIDCKEFYSRLNRCAPCSNCPPKCGIEGFSTCGKC